uniref:Uncharacterized protein n=1 Tax=Helianthus annuus TaxID=4232 RepID=A0A251ULB8_HELAN
MINVYFHGSYEDLRHLQVEASVFIHSRAFNHHNFHHLCSSYSSRSSLAYGPCRYFSQEKQVSRLHANY